MPRTVVVLLDLQRCECLGWAQKDGAYKVHALHDDGQRIFITREPDGSIKWDNEKHPEDAEICELVSLTAAGLRVLRTWYPQGQESSRKPYRTAWASFLGADQIVSMTHGRELKIWNLDSNECKFVAYIADDGIPDVSPDGQTLAFAGDEDLWLWHGGRAQLVGRIPEPKFQRSQLQFNPSGRKLALVHSQELRVYDLTAGTLAHRITLDGFDASRIYAWTGLDHLVVGNGTHTLLVDLTQEAAVWEYELHGIKWAGNICWIVPDLLNRDSVSNVFATAIPHATAAAAIEQVRADRSQWILYPGANVAVDVSRIPEPENQQLVRELLGPKFTERQLQLSDQSEAKFVAFATPQKPKEVQVLTEVSRTSPMGRMENKTITQWDVRLELHYHGQSLWDHSIVTFIPTNTILLRQGETVDQAIVRILRPTYNFVSGAQIPQYLVKPRQGRFLGRSKATMDGLKDES